MNRFLTTTWSSISAPDKATWSTLAEQRSTSNYHAYLSYNMRRWRNYLAPTAASPAVGTDPPAMEGIWSLFIGRECVDITIAYTSVPTSFGVAIFHRLNVPPLGMQHEIIQVLATPDTAPRQVKYTWQQPVNPGNYYFQLRFFSDDGKWGTLGSVLPPPP